MKSENPENKSAMPPYVAYKTFKNFIESLDKNSPPARIDKSLMATHSGGAQAALIKALEYLKLIDTAGTPLQDLISIINAEALNRNEILARLIKASYFYIFENGVSLESATPQLIEEKFKEQGASGSTVYKCITFLLKIAEDASMPVSRHLKRQQSKSMKKPKSGQARRRTDNLKGEDGKEGKPPVKHGKTTNRNSYLEKWLEKIPDFDPQWEPSVQKDWFSAMKTFMEFKKEESSDPNNDEDETI